METREPRADFVAHIGGLEVAPLGSFHKRSLEKLMEVHSLTILHYGKDYLSYALRSVYHSVDQCHVFYTPTPSHGHGTTQSPPETKEELQAAAYAYDPDNKVKWYDVIGVAHEGMQRDIALETVVSAGAELVLVVDCDEIWTQEVLKRTLSMLYEKYHSNRYWLVNMIHFWRSFNWICKDNGWPVRIIDLRFDNEGIKYLSAGQVYHFGYAVTNCIMNYKWEIHGHKNELRPNWFQDKWNRWPPPDDCHPTNENNFWMPQMFDKLQLPEWMRSHPFWGMDKIE